MCREGRFGSAEMGVFGTAVGESFGKRRRDRKVGRGRSILPVVAVRGKDNVGFEEGKVERAQERNR
jgi:hypothetical protein